MLDEQRLYSEFVSLMGKEISIGLKSDGKKYSGTVSSANFDSAVLETSSGNMIVSFTDLAFVETNS